jgi:ActR/RegA family two-component response regulator
VPPRPVADEAVTMQREADPHLPASEYNLLRQAGQLECRCLIISGHDEFAYAQEAVRLGVEDYILKPVNARVLSFQPFQAKSLTQQRNVPFNLPGGLFHIGGTLPLPDHFRA